MVSLMLPDLRAERSRNGDPTPLLRGLALGVAPAPVLEPVFVELDDELRRPLLQALLNLAHGQPWARCSRFSSMGTVCSSLMSSLPMQGCSKAQCSFPAYTHIGSVRPARSKPIDR
jgi:hypothetical protein